MHDHTKDLHAHLNAAYDLVVTHGSGPSAQAIHTVASRALGVDLDETPHVDAADRKRILDHIGSGVACAPGGDEDKADALALCGYLCRVRTTATGVTMYARTAKGEREALARVTV